MSVRAEPSECGLGVSVFFRFIRVGGRVSLDRMVLYVG